VIDTLRYYLLRKRKEAFQVLLTVAKIIAPKLYSTPEEGFDWIIDEVSSYSGRAPGGAANPYEELAGAILIEKALHFMRLKNFEQAIELLKSFEMKDQKLRAMAAVNLTFIYFLENDYDNANHYADLAIEQDRYNANALVNKGIDEEHFRGKFKFLI